MAFNKLKEKFRKARGYVDRAKMKTEDYLEEKREQDLLKRKERVARLEEKRKKIEEKVGLIKRERIARESIGKSRAEQFRVSPLGGLFTQKGISRSKGFSKEPPIYAGLGLFSSAQLKKKKSIKPKKKGRGRQTVKVIIYNQGKIAKKKKQQPRKEKRNESYPTDMDFDIKF